MKYQCLLLSRDDFLGRAAERIGKDKGGEEWLKSASMGGKDDRRTGVEKCGCFTLEVSPGFCRQERIEERQGGPEREERHRKGRLSGLE